MYEIEKLKIEIEILASLEYVSAWTGSLDELRQGSYVKYGDITAAINKRKKRLSELK